MYDTRKVAYCYITVASRAGIGAAVLQALKAAGVSLLAFSGFPTKGGKAQIDLVAEDLGPIKKLAKKQGWAISATKKCFLIRGMDEVGAIEQPISVLASNNINVTASAAVASGDNRYGMILWVSSSDYTRAAKVLNASG